MAANPPRAERATETLIMKVTPSQMAVFESFRSTLNPPMSKSSLIEAAIGAYLERHGAEWPTATVRYPARKAA